MATIEENIANIESAIAEATSASRGLKNYRFEGRTYTPQQINQDLLPSLNARLSNAKKQQSATGEKTKAEQNLAARTQRGTKTILSRIEQAIKSGENSANQYFEAFQNGRMDQATYAEYLNNMEKLRADKAAIESGATAVATGKTGGTHHADVVNSYEVVTPSAPPAPVTAPVDPKETRRAVTNTSKVTPTPGKPTVQSSEIQRINDEPVRVTTYTDGSKKVSKDLSSPASAPAQPAGGGGGVTTTPATKGVKAPKVVNWEPKFRETFPAKAWLLDLDRDKYPGLFNLLQKAITENYTNERFAAEIDGTDFYKELAQSGKVREIKSIVGDLGFDSTDFTKFVSDSINFGWTGDTLKQKTYEEVFRRNADGTYANPTALARAKKSNDFLNVQLVATNYFNKASDATIESVLTGKIMIEDFQRQQREIAKAKYSHLAPLIDQGVTLEDLSANFKQSAARLLEVDPYTIDMGSADYEIALNFGEADKRRVMTTGEWERMLRTDSRYGWEKTENAKEEARALASNIAQAFGRII